jgi:hypothetical protein
LTATKNTLHTYIVSIPNPERAGKMTNHKKPSKEELEQSLKENIKDAEDLEKAPIEEEEPEVPETPEEPKIVIPQEPEEEEETPEPEGEEEVEVEEKAPEPVKEEPKEPDLEKKLSASAKENQKIYAKNRVLNKAIVEADQMAEPTEEELMAEFPDWDVMSDTERKLAKKSVVSDRWTNKIKEASNQVAKIEKWTESVDTFADDPQTLIDNPELEGKAEAFKEFANREANNSVPFNILIGAFLHEQSKVVKHEGKMFEVAGGGPIDKGKPNTGKLTLEEGRKLRESNYDEWKKLLKAGKIESEI